MTQIEKLYNDVFNTLKKKFNEDEEMKQELEYLLHFYGRKLIRKAKNEEQYTMIENDLFDVVKSQYFQGYFTMRSILMDEETTLPNEVWNMFKGIIRNEVPIFLDKIYGNSSDWYRTDISNAVSLKLIQELNEDVYDLLSQMRKDITMYGAYKAIIEDDRYHHPQNNNNTMLLGDPFDLVFLNPQIYMQAEYYSNEQEVWNIYSWSSLNNTGQWKGNFYLSAQPSQEQQLYVLQCTISDTIALDEKYEIINRVIENIPVEIKAVLQIRLNHVSEMEILTKAAAAQ